MVVLVNEADISFLNVYDLKLTIGKVVLGMQLKTINAMVQKNLLVKQTYTRIMAVII